MENVYNTAVKYLQKKYGKTIPDNSDDFEIHLLLKQYYYGEAAKKELKNKLINMGIL